MKRLLITFILSIGLLNPIAQSANAGDGVLFIAEDHLDGYDRTLFKLWIDADKNGCDTRAEVLISEAKVKPKKAAKCKLTGGKWVSSYDGITYTDSSKLDIDHLIPLAEAWRSGAWDWTEEQRTEFANNLSDEQALNAVTASVNRSKGDKDISSWLPKKNVCTYLIGWVSLKSRFSLTVDVEEAKVINKYYKSCGLGHQTKQSVPSPNQSPSQTVAPSPNPSVSTSTTPSASGDPVGAIGGTPTPTPTQQATIVTVSPGAFCAPAGATGKSANGTAYTCKTSPTDSRNRWRQ